MLTPENLDMIKRLQPLLKEKMGEWQHGDQCLLDGKFEDFYCVDCLEHRVFSDKLYDNAIRIPKPIDWQNPERGYWGMIDWETWILDNAGYPLYGQIQLRRRYPDNQFQVTADPFTALLKALCQQENL